jgi:hypothetical protein
MQVMARSLSLLVLAVALMLPTAIGASARTEAPIAPQATFAQSAPHQATRTMMTCRQCFAKHCGAFAVACGAYCGAASAVTPFVVVLMSVNGPTPVPSIFKAARDHGRPPDPYPPRPIAIS